MPELLYDLVDTSDLPARWHCGDWSDRHGWLHIASDLAIWGAYFAIPVVLAYLVMRRRDTMFTGAFWLFGAFILSCGTGHLLEPLMVWWPAYRLLGLCKLVIALMSWVTVLALVTLVPRVLRLPGLAQVNAALAREVEERKQTEALLRIEEEKYRTLVSVMSSMVWSADRDGGFVPSEPWTRYTGQSSEEQAGDGWLAMVYGEDRERVRAEWRQAVQQGARFDASFRLWSAAGGQYCHVELRGVPLRDPEQGIREWIGTITDVDARVRADELQRSNQELDDFAHLASHDLKEPLRGIHHYAGFVIEDCEHLIDDDSVQKLRTIMRLSQRMSTQLDSLLHYSRVNRVDLAMAEVELGAVITEVLDSLQAAIEVQEIDVRIPRPMPRLVCDRARIGELFHNLVSNAIKYNDKPKKWVEIGWMERGQGIVCYVRDNGIGIEPRNIDAIFRMFRRLHGRDEYGSGTGVGLTIVKKIVERHGGEIWVESTPGEGSTFYVALQ